LLETLKADVSYKVSLVLGFFAVFCSLFSFCFFTSKLESLNYPVSPKESSFFIQNQHSTQLEKLSNSSPGINENSRDFIKRKRVFSKLSFYLFLGSLFLFFSAIKTLWLTRFLILSLSCSLTLLLLESLESQFLFLSLSLYFCLLSIGFYSKSFLKKGASYFFYLSFVLFLLFSSKFLLETTSLELRFDKSAFFSILGNWHLIFLSIVIFSLGLALVYSKDRELLISIQQQELREPRLGNLFFKLSLIISCIFSLLELCFANSGLGHPNTITFLIFFSCFLSILLDKILFFLREKKLAKNKIYSLLIVFLFNFCFLIFFNFPPQYYLVERNNNLFNDTRKFFEYLNSKDNLLVNLNISKVYFEDPFFYSFLGFSPKTFQAKTKKTEESDLLIITDSTRKNFSKDFQNKYQPISRALVLGSPGKIYFSNKMLKAKKEFKFDKQSPKSLDIRFVSLKKY